MKASTGHCISTCFALKVRIKITGILERSNYVFSSLGSGNPHALQQIKSLSSSPPFITPDIGHILFRSQFLNELRKASCEGSSAILSKAQA